MAGVGLNAQTGGAEDQLVVFRDIDHGSFYYRLLFTVCHLAPGQESGDAVVGGLVRDIDEGVPRRLRAICWATWRVLPVSL